MSIMSSNQKSHFHKKDKPVSGVTENLDAQQIKANAREIAEEIRDRDLSLEFDKQRKLPEDIVGKLRQGGLFRMNMPRSWVDLK